MTLNDTYNRNGLIGTSLACFIVVLLFLLWVGLVLGPPKPVQLRGSHDEFELDEFNRGRDLEQGVVHDDGEPLRDPDMFTIPEVDEVGESNPNTGHFAPATKYPVSKVQAVKTAKGPLNFGLELARADANTGNDGNSHSNEDAQGARLIGKGVVEPIMGGAILIHCDDDDETLLIPSGKPLPRSKSSRKNKGKGKAREVDDDSSLFSEPFALSHFLSPRKGSRADNLIASRLGSDDALPAVPESVKIRRSRGHSNTQRPVMVRSPTIAGPSNTHNMSHPSKFVITDIVVQSEEENKTRWKPTPPKVSRYRGLSATRSGQKPRSPSPPLPLSAEEYLSQSPGMLASADASVLPAPETFDVDNKRDSWEVFNSGSENEGEEDERADDPDKWSSQIFSTVTGPQAEDDTFQTIVDTESDNNTENKAGRETSDPASGQYPAWKLGGPVVPDSRILTRKVSLPGRMAKFVEVDVNGPVSAPAPAPIPHTGSPVETTVFRDCLELLREGARTPVIPSDLGYEEEEEKALELAKGKTWGMSGALFKRRCNLDGGEGDEVGEKSSKS
ncbi:hypothetical protein VP1G_00899 [Cytospora mali]|uniref:Uncharacterized protein n=1 Tax=Cytospora mali TaxID=578113 RepID=A0A194UPA2_CYTMA|nr:hypothetical protein VP1G_00899 [Valsa mali var. pyri (nom. inval.)]